MTVLREQPQQLAPEGRLGAELGRILDGQFRSEREDVRGWFPATGMHREPGLSLEGAREWTLRRLGALQQAAGTGGASAPTHATVAARPAATVVRFEVIALGDLSVLIKYGVQHGLFGGALANLGTWHRELLAKVDSLELLGCYAMTELGHGSDVFSLETTITHLPEFGELEIHSQTPQSTKAYLGNAARDASVAVVFGQLLVQGKARGVHAVLVPIRDEAGAPTPGVWIGDHGAKGGLVGVDNGLLRFDRVRVPQEMLLDRFGGLTTDGGYSSPIADPKRRFFTMLGTLVTGRVCIAAGAGVVARRGLAIATGYALRRRQFSSKSAPEGELLLDYATHQRRLLPAIAKAYALGFAQNELIAELDRVHLSGEATEEQQRQLETHAAGLKALATRFANDTLSECREACGGAGYLTENRLVELRADADVFATFEGDNTVLLQLVAKSLLSDYRRSWHDLDRMGAVQALARSVGGTVLERTSTGLIADRLVAAARRRGTDVELTDRGWQLDLFRQREEHSLESLAARLRRSRGDQTALNRLGKHLNFVARAHLERTVLEAFAGAVVPQVDSATGAVLGRLCSLYALSSIQGDRGWFQEHHRITATRSKALEQQVAQLCAELRPDAAALIEGFSIPHEWLGAAFLTD